MEEGGVDVPLDVFGIGAEVGCVVNFVLEELHNAISEIKITHKVKRVHWGTYNTSDLIPNEVRRLIDVVTLQQEVVD